MSKVFGNYALTIAIVAMTGPYMGVDKAQIAANNQEAQTAPFQVGEKLVYRLRWGVIPAGQMVLEVRPMKKVDGVEAYHFVMTAKTTGLIDKMYKFRAAVESFTDSDISHSLQFSSHERKKDGRKNVTVTFDWDKQQVTRVKDNESARLPQDVEPGTLDPLALLYAVRQMQISVGADLQGPVSDGKSSFNGTAKVIREEWVNTRAGKFKAFVVVPRLTEVGGVFEGSDDAALQLWLSNDDQRIPLRFASKVALGHFVGELVSVQRS